MRPLHVLLAKRLLILLAILAPALLIATASASSATSSGYQASLTSLTGGTFTHVTVDPNHPNVVYAVGWGATWKSTDSGAHWSLFKSQYLGQDLEVDPTNSNVIYLASRTEVRKTTDGGRTWHTLSGVPGTYALVIDPQDHRTVYVGGNGAIFRSRDAGTSWQKIPISGVGLIHRISIDPSNTNVMYLGDRKAAVWKSTDGGVHWTKMFQGHGSRMPVAVAPSDPQTVYASGKVSHDGGRTWQSAAPAWTIVVDPRNANVAYYGQPGEPVMGTVDGGASFFQLEGIQSNYEAGEVESQAIDPTTDTLYVGASGLFKGTGVSTGRIALHESDDGIYDNTFTDMASGPGAVWVTSDSMGVHKSTDEGQTWQHLILGTQGLDSIRHIALDPNNAKVAFAGHEEVLYKTDNGGTSWSRVFAGPVVSKPIPTVDRSNSNFVYVGLTNHHLYRSSDGGVHWTELSQRGRRVYTDPNNPNVIYTQYAYVYKSTDHGETWTRTSGIIPGTLLISRAHPGTWYAYSDVGGAFDGIYRSAGIGSIWTKLTSYPGRRPRGMFESADGTLWVADFAKGLFMSRDGGNTWENVSSSPMSRVTGDPWNASDVFAAGAPPLSGVWWIHHAGDVLPAPTPPPVANPPQATINIDSCQAIARSNTTYKLTQDVTAVGRGFCFPMPRGVHNVTIDGQGHKVTSIASAIYGDDIQNFTIRDLNIVSRASGISISNARSITLSGNTINAGGRANAGIQITGVLSSNVTATRNVLNVTDLSTGIQISGNGAVVQHNTINASHSSGVAVLNADRAIVTGNDINAGGACPCFGIGLGHVSNALVTANTTTGAYRSGYQTTVSSDNAALIADTVRSTTFNDNHLSATGLSTGQVTYFRHLSSSTFSNNSVLQEMRYRPAMVIKESTDNQFASNTVRASGSDTSGILIVDSVNTALGRNHISVPSGAYSVHTTNSNIVPLSLSGTAASTSTPTPTPLPSPTVTPTSTVTSIPSPSPTPTATASPSPTVSPTSTVVAVHNAASTTLTVDACGPVLHSNAIYRVTQDIWEGANSACFSVPASTHDITIDGQGHTVSSVGPAIEAYGSTDVTIKNVRFVLRSDTYGVDAMRFVDAKGVTIADSSVVTSKRDQSAIAVSGSSASDIELSNNTVSVGPLSIALDVSGNGVSIHDNTISASHSSGIALANAQHVTINGNTVHGGGACPCFGIGFTHVSGASVSQNVLVGAFRAGLRTSVSNDNGALVADSVTDSHFDHNSLTTTGRADGHDVYFNTVSSSTFAHNTVQQQMRDAPAVLLDNSTGNQLLSNTITASGNGSSGVLLRQSPNNVLNANRITVPSGAQSIQFDPPSSSKGTGAPSTDPVVATASPEPTPSPTPTSTPSPSPTPTQAATATPSPTAAPSASISSCKVVTRSDTVYRLTADLSNSGNSPCIVLRAGTHDVSFLGRGHTISSAAEVFSGDHVRNVTIDNVRMAVTSDHIGLHAVDFNDTDGLTVAHSHISMSGRNQSAVYVSGSGSANVTLSANVVSVASLSTGMNLSGSDLTVENNTISASHSSGIALANAQHVTINGNTVHGGGACPCFGIGLTHVSGASVSQNVLVGAFRAGLRTSISNDNGALVADSVTDSHFDHNSLTATGRAGGHVVYFNTVSSSTFAHNTVQQQMRYAPAIVFDNSRGNQFLSNTITASGNGSSGVLLRQSPNNVLNANSISVPPGADRIKNVN